MTVSERNWGGNIAYRARRIARPRSFEELAAVAASGERVAVLATRHTFNEMGDADVLVDLSELTRDPELDVDGVVTVTGTTSYTVLASALQEANRALPNLASLPHISVAGAIASGTHGSGVHLGALATSVESFDVMTHEGRLVTFAADGPDTSGAIVHLGTLGVVTALRLRTEPTYDVAQTVYDRLTWATLLDGFDDVMSSATSVSVFTRYGETPGELWRKQRTDHPGSPPVDGTIRATGDRHPIVGSDGSSCTAQHGNPGPWWERLPHFRHDAVPSTGQEIQSEWFVDRADSVAAIEALRAIAAHIADVLLVSEIRTIARDDIWMSPAHGRDSTGFHFTWTLDPPRVQAAVELVHEALASLRPRLHWGKAMPVDYRASDGDFKRLDDFLALKERLDPVGVFTTPWFARHLSS